MVGAGAFAPGPARAFLGALAALALAACAQKPAPAPDPAPARPTIVSLNPCTDAILAEIAPAQLLAISHYSHDPAASSMDPAQARQFPATSGTVEEVLALKPDLIVADAYLPRATRSAFARLGLRVETIGIAGTFEDSRAQVRRLAAIAGRKPQGEALVARIDRALARSRATGSMVETLLWQAGGLVPGEDSLAARAMAHTGLASHSAARGLGQGAYLPLERVLADPPVLIVTAGEERMLHHPALRALRGTRVARLDPALLYCGGPTIPRLLDRLAQVRRGV